MIRLSGVSKSFDGRVALQPTDLEIAPRQTTALLGPSGCGKSTLLRLMIGLIAPDGGEIHFDGARVDAASAPKLRLRIGYVLQDGGLFPHLTAAGNVSLMARHLGWPQGKIRERLEALAALSRMPEGALDRYPAQLSGGQRQRVGLMRGLMLEPDLLLLDEPLAALDPMVRSELQEDLRGIFRSLGKTVVLVTHDLGEAGFLADDIVLMRDGRIVQRGKLSELARAPAERFVTDFINAQRLPLEALGRPGT